MYISYRIICGHCKFLNNCINNKQLMFQMYKIDNTQLYRLTNVY